MDKNKPVPGAAPWQRRRRVGRQFLHTRGESKIRTIFLTAAGAVLLASAASAADVETPAVLDWTGPYVGLQAGYGWGDLDVRSFFENDRAPNSDGATGIEGALGGAHAGWNYQQDSLVLGVEADVNAADIDGTYTFANDDEFTADINVVGSLRTRLGLVFDDALFYATGGVAIADVDLSVLDYSQEQRERSHETYVGYTVGGGVDYLVSDHLSARLEYRFTDLGHQNFAWDTAFPGYNGDYDLTYHAVQAGLSWHF